MKHPKRSLLVLAAIVLLPAVARAQYPFGKNKVIYQHRDWKVLKTDHVDVYYYPNDTNLVLHVAPLVEETYAQYSKIFDVEFKRRIPLVLYNSHYDFEQTNVAPYLIPESTGGFTDLVKGRVVVPFTGEYGTFRHVVRHELVHAFMLEKMRQVMNAHGRLTYQSPPLWFVEGMAEYIANSPQNTEGNMFVRDALVNGRLLSLHEIWRIQGSFMMYKEGEAVLNYIATSFGQHAIIQILNNWWMADRFSIVLKKTINMNLEQLNDAFMKYIKRRYFPTIMRERFATDIGKQLTRPHSFHSRPVAAFDREGHLVVYSLCARDGVLNLCERTTDAKGRPHERALAKGGRSSALEWIPVFRSKIEAHGDTLVFVSKSNERDVIYFWSSRRRSRIASFSFSGLSQLSSPSLSQDCTKMVFSAIDSTGRMDLFLYNLPARRLERLTDDAFAEEDPDYDPTGDEILFASDRGAHSQRDRMHIYRMDLATRRVTGLEGGDFEDLAPEWAPDGKSFLFTSDRDGTFNIYQRKGDVVIRQTDVIGGATTSSFLPDGSGFVASVYTNGEYHIFRFPLRGEDSGVSIAGAPPDTSSQAWGDTTATKGDFVTQDYKMKLGVDFVGAGVAVDPEFGDVGNGGQMVLTDVLGNHEFFIFFGTTSEGFDDFWKRVNAGITYLNLSHRVNYSLSLFQLNTFRFDRFSTSLYERRLGGAIGIRYPFSKFRRVEGSLVVRQIEREDQFANLHFANRQSLTGSVFLTYVVDNTLWTIGGPNLGWRYYVTGGETVDFQGRGFDNTSVQLDLRHYIKLGRRSLIAMRYLTRNTWGGDEQIFYLGGPWSLRGYDYQQFAGRTIQLINTEVRFPLIDRFALAFPFGSLEMPMFRGSAFFDMGRASRNRADVLNTDWLGSFGLGVELNLGYAPVIRVNFTRRTDFATISPRTGYGLFIGYNF